MTSGIDWDAIESQEAEQHALVDLMQEPPGGENHGSRARTLSGAVTDDGADSPLRTETLSYREFALAEFLNEGGWHATSIDHGRTGFPVGRPRTIPPVDHPDYEGPEGADSPIWPELLEAFEKRLGFTRAEFQEVTRPGRPSQATRIRRAIVISRLREAVGRGAVISALAEVLDCNRVTLERMLGK